jgi:hypothetical protein
MSAVHQRQASALRVSHHKESFMLRDTFFPINQLERPSNSGSATGQKDYALAWKRAKQRQFNSPVTLDASSVVSISAEAQSADKGLVQKTILYQRKI